MPARYAGPSTPFPEPMELGGSASTRSRDLDDSGRPAKQAEVSAPAQQIMAAMEIDHEDEPNLTQFLGLHGGRDYNIEDEQVTDENFEGDLESMLDRLSKPYSKEEPMMDVEELQELDALADLVEITRLQQQGVLIPLEQVEGDDIKTLSTKFVRSWRQKERRGARCARFRNASLVPCDATKLGPLWYNGTFTVVIEVKRLFRAVAKTKLG